MTLDELIETLQNCKKKYGGDVTVGIAYDVQDWPAFQLASKIDTYHFDKYLTEPLLLLVAEDS